MAESPLAQQAVAAAQQGEQQDDQAALQASMYGGRGAFGGSGMMGPGGYDPMMSSPGYGTGVAPKRDSGFSQFVSHQMGSGGLYGGRIEKGPYKGMEPGEAHEQMHEDWLKMSPQDRAQYYQREFGADEADPNNPSGFFSKDQAKAWGWNDKDYADFQQRVGSLPPSQGGLAGTFNPGSMNPGNDPSHHGMDSLLQPPVTPQQAPATNAPPAYGQPSSLSPNPADRDAFQQPAPGSGVVAHPAYVPPIAFTPRPMGNPADTGKFGPSWSGAGSLADFQGKSPPGVSSVSIAPPNYAGPQQSLRTLPDQQRPVGQAMLASSQDGPPKFASVPNPPQASAPLR